MAGKTITLDVSRLREMDVEPLAELFGAMVDIMASGPAKGYDQSMSRRCGLVWALGDLEKRRTSVLHQFKTTGKADREEMMKLLTDIYICLRDFPEVWEPGAYTMPSVDKQDLRREKDLEDSKNFTLEDEVWVNGADYISPEVCCNG